MSQEIKIYKGLVVGTGEHAGILDVWIPAKEGAVPLGLSEYMHENTGSALSGDALLAAKQSSTKCRLTTPLNGGSWFKEVSSRGASVFDHWYKPGDTIYDYRKVDYAPRHSNGLPLTLSYLSDTPAISLAAVSPTLNLSGGTPLANLGNMPPGEFPKVQTNQWVLVAEVNSSITPFIIGSIPSDEAWQTMYT